MSDGLSDLDIIACGVHQERVQWSISAGHHGVKFSTFIEMTDKFTGRCEMLGFRGPLFYDDGKPNTFHGSASDLPSVFMARCSPDVVTARSAVGGSVVELTVYRSVSYPEAAFLMMLFDPSLKRPESLTLEYRLG